MRRTTSILVAIVLILVSIGLVMLFSTSSVRAMERYNDPNYFLKRQAIWLVVASLVGVLVARFDYHWWRGLVPVLAVISLVCLMLVFVPGIGHAAGGASRWLKLGPLTFQPSELAKLTTVIGLCAWMAKIGRRANRFREGLLFPVCGMGFVLVLMLLEPDFGTTLLTGMVGMLILLAGGTRVSYLIVAAVIGASLFTLMVMNDPVRMNRILAFVRPELAPNVAYHLSQSRFAFIRGGLFGVGLGNSDQKQLYLPEAHTDFIFAIVGEELGYIATVAVVLLFVGYCICGMRISFRAPDAFGQLLGFGLTMMIVLQAAINIGVVTGCLPTKGLALPFISYGGSCMVASIAGTCLLINIAAHADDPRKDEHTARFKDRYH